VAVAVAVVVAAVSLAACTGRRSDARPAGTSVPAATSSTSPTSSTTSDQSGPSGPASGVAPTDDVEAQLGTVTRDLDAARSDLRDGATQSTTDTRG